MDKQKKLQISNEVAYKKLEGKTTYQAAEIDYNDSTLRLRVQGELSR